MPEILDQGLLRYSSLGADRQHSPIPVKTDSSGISYGRGGERARRSSLWHTEGSSSGDTYPGEDGLSLQVRAIGLQEAVLILAYCRFGMDLSVMFLYMFLQCTVILFSSRYLFPAKSICPTCEQAIQIFMQIPAAAPPPQKKASPYFCINLCCWARNTMPAIEWGTMFSFKYALLVHKDNLTVGANRNTQHICGRQ